MVADAHELAARRAKARRSLTLLAGIILAPVLLWTLYAMTLGRNPLTGIDTHDFGIVIFETGSEPVLHTFELVNRTSEPIEIIEVKPSCSCLDPRPQLSTEVIAPGGSVNVDVWVRLQESGYKDETVSLIMRDKGAKTLTIRAQGRQAQQITIPEGMVIMDPEHPDNLKLPVNVDIWPEDGESPVLNVRAPANVIAAIEHWERLQPGNSRRGTPAKWNGILRVQPGENGIPVGEIVTIVLNEGQTLEVPLVAPPPIGSIQPTHGPPAPDDHDHDDGDDHSGHDHD